MKNETSRVLLCSLWSINELSGITTSTRIPVRTAMSICSMEKQIPVEARKSELSLMFRPKQSLTMFLKRASIHVVIRSKLAKRIQQHPVRLVNCA
jgi:hypothetical protein